MAATSVGAGAMVMMLRLLLLVAIFLTLDTLPIANVIDTGKAGADGFLQESVIPGEEQEITTAEPSGLRSGASGRLHLLSRYR
jgi:hypothetical protein